ncbi:MAG: tryptophan-rich sensory protein [Candidatus Omnitrophica bacterium]|nr:tryptophan-rich sensory protein [Candidatus Omnitrophota bacterium]
MIKLIISIMISQLAGVIGGLFTGPAIPEWYQSLNKPFFTPPGWIFGPVWAVLYTLMGIALYLVWRKELKTPGVKQALGVYIIQIFLNVLWTVVFFGNRSICGGLVVILLLWIAIAGTVAKFFRVSKPAGLILIPYIAWVSFAAVLNAAIAMLN